MVWLDCQFQNIPSLDIRLFPDDRFAILGNLPLQYLFSAFWAPDEVVDNQMHPMFVSLIFHVVYVAQNNRKINK